MFGDLIFGIIPFSTIDDTPVAPYVRQWINICPEQSDWTEIDKNALLTKECERR